MDRDTRNFVPPRLEKVGFLFGAAYVLPRWLMKAPLDMLTLKARTWKDSKISMNHCIPDAGYSPHSKWYLNLGLNWDLNDSSLSHHWHLTRKFSWESVPDSAVIVYLQKFWFPAPSWGHGKQRKGPCSFPTSIWWQGGWQELQYRPHMSSRLLKHVCVLAFPKVLGRIVFLFMW